ncbi:MAG: hypothetical protein R3290_04570 [Acidimicrobiia bacterium]|nr:hypothetical protein [Acidimicrobiia bacterium]
MRRAGSANCDGRTRVTLRNVVEPVGIGRIMTPILEGMSGRIAERLMPRLKEHLESVG